MKIPKTIKVGAHVYTVELVDGEDIDNDCGEQNRSRNKIKIRRDVPQTQLEETLLHEILHACNSGLKEEIIDGLAVTLYQSLKESNLLK